MCSEPFFHQSLKSYNQRYSRNLFMFVSPSTSAINSGDIMLLWNMSVRFSGHFVLLSWSWHFIFLFVSISVYISFLCFPFPTPVLEDGSWTLYECPNACGSFLSVFFFVVIFLWALASLAHLYIDIASVKKFKSRFWRHRRKSRGIRALLQ